MYDISQLAYSSRGLRKIGVAVAVFALGAGTVQFGVEAQEETSRYQPQQATGAPAEPEFRRVSRTERQSDVTAFVSPKGRTVFTNNPEKFRNRRGYTEIDPRAARSPQRSARTTYQYRNPGTIVAAPAVRGIPAEIKRHVEYFARQNGLDESLVYAVIYAESSFNTNARSVKGAEGLMQLMPATAKQMGVRNVFDAGENIRGGTRYLAKLLDRFDGDLQLALAGYNAGPEKVKEYGGIPPYKETQDFVRRVIKRRNELYDGGVRVVASSSLHGSGSAAVVSDNRRRSDYMVHFTSGHTQQAQNVIEDGDHYIIQYRGRSFRVKKSQISKVSQGA